MKTLQPQTKLGRFGSMFASFGAVLDVANALEAHRQPSREALRTLGMDEAAFHKINLR